MAYTQFNGCNIIPLPSTPSPTTIDFGFQDAVGEVVSPFTRQTQEQAWPGADYWEINLSLPPMPQATARPWVAFLAALRGKTSVFQIGDPIGKTPRGNPQGAPVVDGVNLASAILLKTSGWTANAQGVLKPGDYLQIGYHLHIVAQATDVNADANGKATIEIWPSLRDTSAGGESIVLNNTKGIFRLPDNKRTYAIDRNKFYVVGFSAVEAR